MKRPLTHRRPVGPILHFSNGGRPVTYTILIGMESGTSPSMTGLEDDFRTSVAFGISQELGIDRDEFHVFSESLVAEELDRASQWMTVIKIHMLDITKDEAEMVAFGASEVLEGLSFNPIDEFVAEGDYFGE